MLKILCVNIWPIASKSAIGYMGEHLFNNKELFQIMEIYTNDVEIYEDITIKRYCDINRCKVKRKIPQCYKAWTVPDKKKNLYIIDLVKLLLKCVTPIVIEREILEDIYAFNPDVIYTQGYDVRILRVANRIANLMDRKIVVHTLDDWFTTGKKMSDYLKRMVLKRILSKAISFSASPAMTERLRELFSCESTFISNCAPFIDEQIETKEEVIGCKLLYVGNLTPSRYLALAELANLLKMPEYLPSEKIDIYAPPEQIEEYGEVFGDNVVLHNSVEQKEVAKLISGAKIVLHIESFDEDCHDFIKFSLSTKIAEYTSFGKPIIYYGPLDVGVARFLIDNEIGEAFDDVVLAASKIRDLFWLSKEYQTMSEKTRGNAKFFFDTDIVQNRIIKNIKGNR